MHYYMYATLLSSLNASVVGNIIGSGTALTNLNYNAITNKPDFALNSSLNIISNNRQDTYTTERQYPPKAYDQATNDVTTEILNKSIYTQYITLNTKN